MTMINNIWKESPLHTDTPSNQEYAEAIYNLPSLVRRVNALEHRIEELKTKAV